MTPSQVSERGSKKGKITMKYCKAEDFHLSVEDKIDEWWTVFKHSLDDRQLLLMTAQDVVDLYWEHLLNQD